MIKQMLYQIIRYFVIPVRVHAMCIVYAYAVRNAHNQKALQERLPIYLKLPRK